jgi:hypothetical protein
VKYTVEFKYRFELLIPAADNRGRPFPWSKIDNVSSTLLERFDGCRSQPLTPYLGMWKFRGKVYREGMLLFIVDAPRSDESLEWMLSYKERLKRHFNQIDLYLAVSELLWL